MTNPHKQIIATLVFVAVTASVGGFCYGAPKASAAAVDAGKEVSVGQSMPGMEHCTESVEIAPGANQIQKANPFGNAVMPCCVGAHDNTPTTLPTALKNKVNLSSVTAPVLSAQPVSLSESPLYTSSSGPPKTPDILSSVFKKE